MFTASRITVSRIEVGVSSRVMVASIRASGICLIADWPARLNAFAPHAERRQSLLGAASERAPRPRWRERIPARLQDGPRRHRVEAARLALSLRPIEGLAEIQEPGSAC